MALNSLVISDSTTLISLLNIERFELLFKFSKTIIVSKAVYDKVTKRKSAKRVFDGYITDSRVIVQAVKNRTEVEKLLLRLDLGESESIVMAKEENLPLIIDEKRGRNIANNLGVETIGLVGILLVYRKKSYLSAEEIEEIVIELREVNFRISQTLLDLLLEE